MNRLSLAARLTVAATAAAVAVAAAVPAQAGAPVPRGMTAQEWKALLVGSEALNRHYHLGAHANTGNAAARRADRLRGEALNASAAGKHDAVSGTLKINVQFTPRTAVAATCPDGLPGTPVCTRLNGQVVVSGLGLVQVNALETSAEPSSCDPGQSCANTTVTGSFTSPLGAISFTGNNAFDIHHLADQISGSGSGDLAGATLTGLWGEHGGNTIPLYLTLTAPGVAFDTTPPVVSRLHATVSRLTARRYRVRLSFRASDANQVSFLVKLGTRLVATNSRMFQLTPPAGARSVRLTLIVNDNRGNSSHHTLTIRLP